jgi:hypothetical protein
MMFDEFLAKLIDISDLERKVDFLLGVAAKHGIEVLLMWYKDTRWLIAIDHNKKAVVLKILDASIYYWQDPNTGELVVDIK